MDLNGKNAGAVTPAKNPHPSRSKASEISKDSENFNPNVASPAGCKSAKSPAIKSATKTTQKSGSRNPNPVASPRNKIRERKFVVAKRNSKKEKTGSATVVCKCKEKVGGDSQKCLCVAYESLRASQEEFFKNRNRTDRYDLEQSKNCSGADNAIEEEEEAGKKDSVVQAREIGNGFEREQEKIEGLTIDRIGSHPDETQSSDAMGALLVKRRRDKLLEEARERGPETGSGKVMHLVKIFEKLLTIPQSEESDQEDDKEAEDEKKGMKWALPGLHPKVPETQVSSSSFCPSDFFLTSESLGLDSRVSSSLDSNRGSLTISSRTSSGRGHRNRRNSSESAGTLNGRWWKKKQLKTTRQKPFKLQTEQRGRCKEEEFLKKVQEMKMEEDKLRIPIAQGLPWTTDEPECLVKPPVKESTRPIDPVLHSDVRAVERAEFDQQVAEKMSLIEQYRMERELQQKLEEEEEIRRLRKELIPRAQPMPYFDRPFIPRRSEKLPTIPKDLKFYIPQHKKIKCCASWNDLYTHQQ